MKPQMIRVRGLVKDLLTSFPETRDNDRLLILKVWAVQFPDLRNPYASVSEFTKRYLTNSLADTESIRRTRQKLQEQHPELRGASYQFKQREAKEIRQLMLNT